MRSCDDFFSKIDALRKKETVLPYQGQCCTWIEFFTIESTPIIYRNLSMPRQPPESRHVSRSKSTPANASTTLRQPMRATSGGINEMRRPGRASGPKTATSIKRPMSNRQRVATMAAIDMSASFCSLGSPGSLDGGRSRRGGDGRGFRSHESSTADQSSTSPSESKGCNDNGSTQRENPIERDFVSRERTIDKQSTADIVCVRRERTADRLIRRETSVDSSVASTQKAGDASSARSRERREGRGRDKDLPRSNSRSRRDRSNSRSRRDRSTSKSRGSRSRSRNSRAQSRLNSRALRNRNLRSPTPDAQENNTVDEVTSPPLSATNRTGRWVSDDELTDFVDSPEANSRQGERQERGSRDDLRRARSPKMRDRRESRAPRSSSSTPEQSNSGETLSSLNSVTSSTSTEKRRTESRKPPRRTKSNDDSDKSKNISGFLEPSRRRKTQLSGSRSVGSSDSGITLVGRSRRRKLEQLKSNSNNKTRQPSSRSTSATERDDLDIEKESYEGDKEQMKDSDKKSFREIELEREREKGRQLHMNRTDNLLYSVFPKHIAEALRQGKKVEPENHECVTIFFSDIVGFTDISSNLDPLKISDLLDRLYSSFDTLSTYHDVFKVETIGDAYMAVTNLTKSQPDHCKRIAQFAMDAIRAANQTPIDRDDPSFGNVNIRVGFHSGPVVSNVVGSRNPRYCLFGDTVNTASRMESNSLVNRIHCSEDSARLLQLQYPEMKVASRGAIDVKGKGKMNTYWVNEDDPEKRNGLTNSLLNFMKRPTRKETMQSPP